MRNPLEQIESGLEKVAQTALAFMMCIVAVDVIGRYVLRAPVPWAQEVTTIYLMPAVFFLGMPTSFRSHAHISVDILYRNMPGPLKWICGLISQLAILVFVAPLCYFSALRTMEAYHSGESTIGWTAWPTWIANLVVPLACILMTLRTIVYVVKHFQGRLEPQPAGESADAGIGVE